MSNQDIAEMIQRADDEISMVVEILADLAHADVGYRLYQTQRLLRDAEEELLKEHP